jgi:hypothetical protein
MLRWEDRVDMNGDELDEARGLKSFERAIFRLVMFGDNDKEFECEQLAIPRETVTAISLLFSKTWIKPAFPFVLP